MTKSFNGISKKDWYSLVAKYKLDDDDLVTIEYRFPCEHLRAEFVKLLQKADVGIGFSSSSDD